MMFRKAGLPTPRAPEGRSNTSNQSLVVNRQRDRYPNEAVLSFDVTFLKLGNNSLLITGI
ncbi:GSCOCT00014264001.2-RA-CDS [Cotesia congregata]|uniref:Cc_single_5.4 n=2 Tax=root TaxID=1 RepID=S6D9I5_COTCN|nr:hypothetical protein CcBV_5.4 [Bracoviriform congregatae]CAD6243363.1 GSCOCT00014264001.2-RA-CDS [Cotesia congregata]CAG17410.1 hypothetical protein CcBV_5.4 [Bracoviriform congregatae]CAG5092351.1 cc_single_5.4 [Cotesia congregata]CCQ71101.1 hypothetical protein CcBV_5.4 [Cotesia congregata]